MISDDCEIFEVGYLFEHIKNHFGELGQKHGIFMERCHHLLDEPRAL